MRARVSRVSISPVVAAFALCGLLSLRGAARAEDGEPGPAPEPEAAEGEKENAIEEEGHDFAWKVPAKWEFEDPSEEDQSAGYVAVARRPVSPGVEIAAWVLVKEAGGMSLDAAVAQVRDNKTKALKDVKVEAGARAWAGSQSARAMRILGKAENGSTVVWFCRAAIVSGKYHELDVRATNGAHNELQGEIDKAIGGYRVLSAPPPEEDAGGGEAPAAGDPLSKRFENLGLTWTLPAPGRKELPAVKEGEDPRVFAWGFTPEGNPKLARQEEGVVAGAGLELNGETIIHIRLRLPRVSNADLSPADLVKQEDSFRGIDQMFDGAPIPQVDEDCKVGNTRGAQRSASGKAKEGGKPLWRRFYFVTLQKQLFEVELIAWNDWQQKEKDWWAKAMDGLKWDDTKSGIRGPLATPFVTASEPRGNGWSDFGKERKFTGSISYTKPAAFGALSTESEESWVFAGEARKANMYLFVGIRRYDNKLYGAANPKKDPDSLIDDFEAEWKNGVDDAVTRPKNGKSNRTASGFRGAKGSTYFFTGKKGGVPFAERGWVVTAKAYVYHIRAQYGGADAEAAFAPEWKDFSSSMKFE